jgi:hypothetical protein
MATIAGLKRFLEIDSVAEAVPGVMNGASAGNLEYAELISAGFNINESPQFDDIAVEANLDAQPAPQTAGFRPEGNVEIVAAPFDAAVPTATQSWMRFIFDWTIARTSGVLDAHTLTQWNPITGSGFGRQVTGCKPNTMNLTWSSTDRLKNPVLGIMGMFPSKSTASVPASPAFPTNRFWNFTYIGAQVSGTAYSTYTGATSADKTLRNVSIDVSNGITQESPGYQYASDGTLITGISELSEGDLEVTGSFERALKNATEFFDPMLAGTTGQIRLVGFHPNASKTTIVDSAGIDTSNASDGGASTITVTVTDASIFTVGNYVYIEDTTASDPDSWKREVLYVQTVNESANTIVLNLNGQDTLKESIGRGQTFVDGSYIYNLGIQLFIRDFTITGWEPVGGAPDKIYERITFRAGVFTGTHPNEGANYNHPVLGYCVQ